MGLILIVSIILYNPEFTTKFNPKNSNYLKIFVNGLFYCKKSNYRS